MGTLDDAKALGKDVVRSTVVLAGALSLLQVGGMLYKRYKDRKIQATTSADNQDVALAKDDGSEGLGNKEFFRGKADGMLNRLEEAQKTSEENLKQAQRWNPFS